MSENSIKTNLFEYTTLVFKEAAHIQLKLSNSIVKIYEKN